MFLASKVNQKRRKTRMNESKRMVCLPFGSIAQPRSVRPGRLAGCSLSQFCPVHYLRADALESAFVAVWLARCANVSAVQQQPVVGQGDVFPWYVFHQCLLHFHWCGVAFSPEPAPGLRWPSCAPRRAGRAARSCLQAPRRCAARRAFGPARPGAWPLRWGKTRC